MQLKGGQKQTYYLWDCLEWCDDLSRVRAHYLQAGYRENLFINHPDLGVFGCEKNGEQCIFARAGSELPFLASASLPKGA